VRRTSEAARENILNAAERLLAASGPQSLKLADVAGEAGVANASVLHHFGSIGAMQVALAERMIADLVTRILAINEAGGGGPSPVSANALFDAFEERGAARLSAWLVMTDEADRLTIVREAVTGVAARAFAGQGLSRQDSENLVMIAVVLAMGVGLFGKTFSTLMEKPEGHARALVMTVLLEHAATRIKG
jgi:AcrR family transcriptional regulator